MIELFENRYVATAALILGFGFLIFIHELGHFAVAKWVGIRATQFAIGFGNAFLAFRRGLGFRAGGTEKEYASRAIEALRRDGVSLEGLDEHKRNQLIMERADALGLGETEYRLNTLPLGGYVKMLGQEDLDPSAQSDDPRAFNRKSIGARAAVISAGVVMNLIFGLLFFIIAFRLGVEFPAAVVGDVRTDSAAQTTYAVGHEGDAAYRGFQPGDVITHINGERISDMAEVRIATALGRGGTPVAMTVAREGEAEALVYSIVPTASPETEGLLSAGITPSQTLIVGESRSEDGAAAVSRGSVFADAGLEPGMVLRSVNGRAVANAGQYHRAVAALESPQLTLTFGQAGGGGEEVVVQTVATPTLMRDADKEAGVQLLGLRPAVRIEMAQPGEPAARAGVEAGDVMARIGSVNWPDVKTLPRTVQNAQAPLPLKVWREGQVVDLGLVKPTRRGLIGVVMSVAYDHSLISSVAAASPFARASADRPLPGGSRLAAVGDTPIRTWSDFQHAVRAAVGGADADESVTLTLSFEVNLGRGEAESYEVVLEPAEAAELREALAWAPPRGVTFLPLMAKVKADTPWEATVIGLDKTGQFVQQTYITLLRLIQGSIGVKNLRGPVGIVDEGAKISAQGLPYFLFFLGLISVNLAVLNFLPLPIVDGGLMVFLIIEKIKGSPASPQVQMAVSLVGLVGLACVFLVVTYHDISRLVLG